MTDVASPPGHQIQAMLAVADRRRRERDARLRLTRWVPRGAAGLLGLAVVSRWLPGGAAWPLMAAGAGLGWMLAVALRARRAIALDDDAAREIDDASGLGGELRSAWWFSSRSTDAWQQFHLQQAAERLAGIAWADVFPLAPWRRPALWSVLLVAAAAVAAWPQVSGRVPTAIEARVAPVAPADVPMESLPPDLKQQMLDVLAAIARGELSSEEALVDLSQSSDWSSLPAVLKAQLAEKLRRVTLADKAPTGRPAPAAPGASPEEAEWAREDLAAREANEQAQKGDRDEKVSSALDGKPEKSGGVETSASGEKGEASDMKASSVQRVPPSGQGGSSAAVMLEQKDAGSGEAGSGLGGKRGETSRAPVDTPAIEAVLRRELVRAEVNREGAEQSPEDKRRNTERRASGQSFTRAAERSSYDRSRADAAHTVPEARLSWLERYFVRSEGSR